MTVLLTWIGIGFTSWCLAMIYRAIENYTKKHSVNPLLKGLFFALVLGPLVIPVMFIVAIFLHDSEVKDDKH